MRSILKSARLARGLTQEDLGKRIGMTKKGIWAIEHGITHGRVRTWDRLEEVLGVDQKLLRRLDPDGAAVETAPLEG